jgi:hypothetical protein
VPGKKPRNNRLKSCPSAGLAQANWTVPANTAGDQVFYLLRVYDAQGRFR